MNEGQLQEVEQRLSLKNWYSEEEEGVIRELAAEVRRLQAVLAEVAHAGEAKNQELHRRAQAAESALAQGTPERVQALEAKLAETQVEKHKYRNENAFMKSERRRLQARIKELDSKNVEPMFSGGENAAE